MQMKIDKEKFFTLWNEIYARQQLIPSGQGIPEAYYLSGCLDVMRKIQNELMEKEENDNA